MARDFASVVRPHIEAMLEPGEVLNGLMAASHQRTFGGEMYAVGVTDRRLLLAPLDRRSQPKGQARSIAPGELAAADVDGAGGGWWTAPAAILDGSAIALTLKTRDGDKIKLQMMQGGGGLLSGLGGGEAQRDGVRALAAWLSQHLGDR